MPFLREVSPVGIEARRWTVVFHRKAENWFFAAIAMGHFKHVSALAWIPELSLWLVYDVGFRRTRLRILEDGPTAAGIIAGIVEGNAAVTLDARDDLPWMRLGMFCTTSVAHLIGVRCAALRPDALYRHLKGLGTVIDDAAAGKAEDRRRSELRGRQGARGADVDQQPANAGTG